MARVKCIGLIHEVEIYFDQAQCAFLEAFTSISAHCWELEQLKPRFG
jgi:hypothetical protein